MFVSQVIFESQKENEETVKAIITEKLNEVKTAEGLISSEGWKKESHDNVCYCIVNKWKAKSDFQLWMKISHADQTKNSKQAKSLDIKKTAYQFETIE